MAIARRGVAYRTARARRWLTGRCTLEAPSGSGLTAGWGTPITNVPYRREAAPASPVWAPLGPPGGPIGHQRATYYLDAAAAAGAALGWRLEDADGVYWRLQGGLDTTDEVVNVFEAEQLGA